VAVPDPTPKNPLGPTGRRAAQTVAELRDRDNLSYRELSNRLSDLGRTIPMLGLSRVERTERRIDADDLVALALALGTTPNRLLLPGTARRDVGVALTSAIEITEQFAWAWAEGKAPLVAALGGEGPGGWVSSETFSKFVARSRPDEHRPGLPAIAPHLDVVTQVNKLIEELAAERGIQPAILLAMVQVVRAEGLDPPASAESPEAQP